MNSTTCKYFPLIFKKMPQHIQMEVLFGMNYTFLLRNQVLIQMIHQLKIYRLPCKVSRSQSSYHLILLQLGGHIRRILDVLQLLEAGLLRVRGSIRVPYEVVRNQ